MGGGGGAHFTIQLRKLTEQIGEIDLDGKEIGEYIFSIGIFKLDYL